MFVAVDVRLLLGGKYSEKRNGGGIDGSTEQETMLSMNDYTKERDDSTRSLVKE